MSIHRKPKLGSWLIGFLMPIAWLLNPDSVRKTARRSFHALPGQALNVLGQDLTTVGGRRAVVTRATSSTAETNVIFHHYFTYSPGGEIVTVICQAPSGDDMSWSRSGAGLRWLTSLEPGSDSSSVTVTVAMPE